MTEKYYLCKEKGTILKHNCASVKYVNGHQVCGAVQFQIDYCGHVFCANICGQVEIDEDQMQMEFEK